MPAPTDGATKAGAVAAPAEPGNRKQETKQRQAGNGFRDIRAAEDRLRKPRAFGHDNSERHANAHREQDRNSDQPDMFECALKDFAMMARKKLQQGHRSPSSFGYIRRFAT